MAVSTDRNRPRLPESDRREIAKRIFDALYRKVRRTGPAALNSGGPILITAKGRTALAHGDSCRRARLTHAQYPSFEQMVISIRQRLRPTNAYLLADRLRICVGLNYSKADETRLLKMLLEEVSLT
jgi:hypothetical protein